MEISRREFLANTLLTAGAVLAAPPLLHRIAQAAESVEKGPAAPALVVIQLLGGNDGLNTVIPYQDPAYAKARPNLGLSSKEVLTLQQGMALNPALQSLYPIWNEGHLAIVQNVGYENPIRSHFESMDIWNTANIKHPVGDGWLARYVTRSLHGKSGTLAAVGIGNTLPAMLRSEGVMLTSLEGILFFQLLGPRKKRELAEEDEQTLLELYAHANVGAYGDLMKQTVEAAFENSRALQQIVQSYETNAPYPHGRLGNSLKLAAQILTSGLGTRVVHLSLGGFDTHTGQKPQQARLLQELSNGLSAFYADLGHHGIADQVVIMTVSEFGRRVAENASGGTDHGAASSHFILGNRIKGGLYGGEPYLEDLDMGDLKYKVDFRSVYATMVQDFLGALPATVLEGSFPILPILNPPKSGAVVKKHPSALEPAPRHNVLFGLANQFLKQMTLKVFPD